MIDQEDFVSQTTNSREESDSVALSAGHIRYRTDLVPNPARHDDGDGIYSPELQFAFTRRNLPEYRDVWFDGKRARIECVNFDYGVYSRSILLQGAEGSTGNIYCKEFPFFKFCIEYPVQLPTAPWEPPRVTLLKEEKEILGYRCRRARIEDGAVEYLVYYAPTLKIAKVTDAVLQHSLVDGFILEREENPDKHLGIFLTRITVTELNLTKPPANRFESPDGFEKVTDIDFARTENRRRLDAWSAEQWTRNPLTANEKTMYLGAWQLDKGKDHILVEIEAAPTDSENGGDPGWNNNFVFITTVLSSNQEFEGALSCERATMKGRLLLVEEPPNYSLYSLSENGNQMQWTDNPALTYYRIDVDKVRSV